MVGENIERHLVVETLVKQLDRAAHRAPVLAFRAANGRECGDCLDEGDLEREPARASPHRVVKAMESDATRVSCGEMRMDTKLAVGVFHDARWEGDDLISRR